MANSLELIRVKIAELEAKLTDLRIAERELVALEPELARKTTTPRVSKPKPMRTEKVASPARQTISAAIAEVLNAHGALPAVEIAEYIKAGGREIGKRTISHSLQALKKRGRSSTNLDRTHAGRFESICRHSMTPPSERPAR